MFERIRNHWLPWLLCRFFLCLAGLLMLLVLACPFLYDGRRNPHEGRRWVAMFANDLAVRRTAIASSLGLAVTAWIFFRPKQETANSVLDASEIQFPENREP